MTISNICNVEETPNQFYKQILEWIVKFFVYMAPVFIGFLGMTAYNSLRETVTWKKFIAHLGISVAVSMGVYELIKIYPMFTPATGLIIGVCSAFSIPITEILIKNLPDMLRTVLKTLFTIGVSKLDNKDTKGDDNDNDNS